MKKVTDIDKMIAEKEIPGKVCHTVLDGVMIFRDRKTGKFCRQKEDGGFVFLPSNSRLVKKSA